MSKEIYSHETLPGGTWFRLLRLSPAPRGAPLVCELVTTQLHEAPSYEAISYAWGDPNEKIEIICNNMPFWITVNLHGALERLRHGNEPRVLWADGLCIDQLNDIEKGHQVGLMVEIYRKSECTLVWLGPAWDEKGVEITFDLIDKTTHIANVEYERRGRPDLGHFITRVSSIAFIQDYLHEKWTDHNMAHLTNLFEKAWFSRIWVQQEIGISQQAVAYCGDSKIQMSKLVLIAALSDHLFGVATHIEVGRLSNALSDFYCSFGNGTLWLRESTLLEYMATYFLETHHSRNFEGRICSVLECSRHFHASDARDHIFALLGHPAMKELVEPDYTVSLSDMQLSLAQRMVLKSSTLELLLYVEHDEEDLESSFPSWAPQWHKVGPFVYEIHPYWYNCWIKTGETPCPSFSLHGNSLCIEGFLLGVVNTVSQTMCDELWEPMRLYSTNNPVPNGYKDKSTHFLEAAWETFSQSALNTPEFAWTDFFKTISAGAYVYESWLYGDIFAFVQETCSRKFCETVKRNIGSWFKEDCSATRFRSYVTEHNYNRKLFATKTGLFGNGSFLIQEGDSLMLVRGCRMPLVVRSVGQDHYKLVGPCYIQELHRDKRTDEILEGMGLHQKKAITLV